MAAALPQGAPDRRLQSAPVPDVGSPSDSSPPQPHSATGDEQHSPNPPGSHTISSPSLLCALPPRMQHPCRTQGELFCREAVVIGDYRQWRRGWRQQGPWPHPMFGAKKLILLTSVLHLAQAHVRTYRVYRLESRTVRSLAVRGAIHVTTPIAIQILAAVPPAPPHPPRRPAVKAPPSGFKDSRSTLSDLATPIIPELLSICLHCSLQHVHIQAARSRYVAARSRIIIMKLKRRQLTLLTRETMLMFR